MKPIFKIPELLDLDGRIFGSLDPNPDPDDDCQKGCSSGCRTGCDVGEGLNDD